MDRYYAINVLTAAGTQKTFSIITKVLLENALLVDIGVLIPSGHGGLTGVRILSSNQLVLPFNGGAYIIADNYDHIFPVGTEIGVRSISIETYNEDVYDHTHYLKFHLTDLAPTGVSSPSQASASLVTAISEGAPGTTGSLIIPSTATTPGGLTLPPLPPPPILTIH